MFANKWEIHRLRDINGIPSNLHKEIGNCGYEFYITTFDLLYIKYK